MSDILRTDLNMVDVATTNDVINTELPLTMRNHVNPLLQNAAQILPLPRIATSLKRNHGMHNLEPTDELTAT